MSGMKREGLRLRRGSSDPSLHRGSCTNADGRPSPSPDLSPQSCPHGADTRGWLCQQFLRQAWEALEHDITCARVLHHEPRSALKALHMNSICYIVLLAVAIIVLAYFLQRMLLPVILAAGLAVLLEPVSFIPIDLYVQCCTPMANRPRISGVHADGAIGIEVMAPARQSLHPNACTCYSLQQTEEAISSLLRRICCVAVVTSLIMGVLAAIFGLGIWVVSSVDSVDWGKYKNGPRMRFFRATMAQYGVHDFDDAMSKAISFVVRKAGFKILGSTMTVLSEFLLMVLFLGFFLIDSVTERSVGKEPWRRSQRKVAKQLLRGRGDFQVHTDEVPLAGTFMGRLRIQMRAYMWAKFLLSLLKAVVIAAVFFALDVDLWFLWAVLTFVLNFVPLGSSISTFAPLPFVIMDPTKSYVAIAVILLWPLLVHNFVGNVVEPRAFAHSLKLHPVTVLFALTFWTSLWGILGALVCVPLTAIFRIMLKEVESHPYAAALLRLLEGVVQEPSWDTSLPESYRNRM